MSRLDISTVTVTSNGTRVQFGTSTAPWQAITVKARPNNSSLVYVGTSAVTSTSGITLDAGDSFVFQAGDVDKGGGVQLAQLYVDADVNNDRVDYFAYSD